MIRIIIPVYNEEKNIEACIIGADRELKTKPHRFYVVNDGSSDDTSKILRRLAKKLPLKIINHKTNKGVAGAFSSGIKKVLAEGRKGDIVVIMEGDGTSDPRLLPVMIERVKRGRDIIIASRYQKGGGYRNFPLKRLVFSRSANLVFRALFFSREVRDYTIFYRAYSFEIIKKTSRIYKDNLITTQNFTANAEMLIKMMNISRKIDEVAFVYNYGRKQGKSGMNVASNLLQYLRFLTRVVRGKV